MLCFILMLVPQIVLNARKKSTEGLSFGLVGIWHVASILSAAFYVTQPESQMAACSMACFSLASAIIEGQMVAYGPLLEGTTRRRQVSVLVGVSVVATIASFCSSGAVAWLILRLSTDAKFLLGDVLPGVLLALGFIPQFYEFISNWSIEGYSFGVTVFDVVGSTGNTLALFATAGVQPAQALVAAAPFLTIIAMHVVLLMIAAVIVCRRAKPLPTDPWVLKDEAMTDKVLRSLSRSTFSCSSEELVEEKGYICMP